MTDRPSIYNKSLHMKLSNIILERVTPAEKGKAMEKVLELAKELGMYSGIEDGMGSRGVIAIDGILRRHFRKDIDAAVAQYGEDAIESISVEKINGGAAFKLNFKEGMGPKGLTAADVRSGGPLD